MKKLILTAGLTVWCILLFSQHADSVWFVNNYTKMEQQIAMRDGIRLFTSIYMPKDMSEKHPMLIERTPYSCAPYGEDQWKKYWNSFWLTGRRYFS